MAADSSSTRDTASPNLPRQPATVKGSAVGASVGNCSSPQLSSDTAVSSSSENLRSAQLQVSMSTMSISGNATSGQPCNEQPHLGSDSRKGNHNFPTTASTSSCSSKKRTSTGQDSCELPSVSAQHADEESLNTIEAQKLAEVPTSAATDTLPTDVGTATIHGDLSTALAPGQTQGQAMSGDSSGHHARATPRPSSSGSSSSGVSLPGTPAPPHELRPPRPSAIPARNKGLRLEVIHEADGLRIENCPPDCHVAIYTPNDVRISLQPPPSTVDYFGQVVSMVFGFKVTQDSGICVLGMREGTKASGMVVPTVQGREAGAQGGGVIVEEIFTAVDGYTVTFRFAL